MCQNKLFNTYVTTASSIDIYSVSRKKTPKCFL